MRIDLFRWTLVLLAALLVLPIAACSFEEGDKVSPTEPAPPPPPPVNVTALGGCDVEGSSINCIDQSTTSPSDSCEDVAWTLRRGSATVSGSLSGQCRGTISFGPGLPSGTYAVDQVVTANDGQSDQATYSNLEVF